MTFLSGTDYFGVFRIHDARTGEIPPVLAEGEQGIYLTPDVAEKLFGEKYTQNKWIHWGDSTRKSPLKHRGVRLPKLCITTKKEWK